MLNRVAIITGASKGIGRACALKFAENGIDVVINYNKSEKEAFELVDVISAFGGNAIAIKADVSDSKAVHKLFKESIDYYGRVDILVNNAGIVEDSFIIMLGEKALEQNINVNLKSYLYCCRQAASHMFKKNTGKIINISSVSAIRGIAGQALYGSTKGAVNSLTRVLAKELASYGIQVNAIAPGFIDTDMLSKLSEEKKQKYVEAIPAGRFGRADEVAEVVYFLCQDKAEYITGQVIVIDGGMSVTL